MQSFGLGIDIGGTFTDVVLFDTVSGTQFSHKQLTTPTDPTIGVIDGVSHLLKQTGIDAKQISRVVHATTLFTNALIERKGAATGLITTKGFRDVLEIGRERKYELYDLNIQKPEPLVARNFRVGVEERVEVDGRVSTPLNEDELLSQAGELIKAGTETLAVVFLHSYANQVHEKRALELLSNAFPNVPLSGSIDVAPEIREYERTSTTACNAYIKPLAERYLDSLEKRLRDIGVTAQLLMMLSSGGLTNIDEAKRNPVQLLESGPAAGALAAAHLAGADGGDHVLAFDMGGTTAKLSVIDNGAPAIAYSFEAARAKRFIEGSGLPLRISTLELIEIGAGGGSIAHIDNIGLLKVGPLSAGSEPGPACYDRGGHDPAVTDANLLLGYLNPDFFAGGSMTVDPKLATNALAPLSEKTSLTTEQLAWGVHELVNENMANAARVHIAEHGKDPRSYNLFATGGGGPLHGYHVAKKLGLKRLIVPPSAGVASALGLLIAPARVDRVATLVKEISTLDWGDFEQRFQDLTDRAKAVIAETGLDSDGAVIQRAADIRYRGQAFELVVDLPPGPYNAGSKALLLEAFETNYVEAFTRTPPATEVEIINIRVSATLDVSGASEWLSDTQDASEQSVATRPAYFPESGGKVDTPVYQRAAIAGGKTYQGPAIIEEPESTLIVGPGGTFTKQASGNIVVEIN